MLSYPRRPQSGQITCYLNRTYHVLTTMGQPHSVKSCKNRLVRPPKESNRVYICSGFHASQSGRCGDVGIPVRSHSSGASYKQVEDKPCGGTKFVKCPA